MDRKALAALQKIMGAIGDIENGTVHLSDPYAQRPDMFDAYETIMVWMRELKTQKRRLRKILEIMTYIFEDSHEVEDKKLLEDISAIRAWIGSK